MAIRGHEVSAVHVWVKLVIATEHEHFRMMLQKSFQATESLLQQGWQPVVWNGLLQVFAHLTNRQRSVL